MTQTTPLAACPFCGGEAQRHTIGEDEPSNAGGDVICCTRCQASSHVEFGRKENLVSAWNQRTHPTAQHGDLVERGWLIEEDYGHGVHWIALAKDSWPRWKTSTRWRRRDSDLDLEAQEYLTPVHRVKDASEALRFARKEDAEAFIALFDRYLLQAKATEHEWHGPEAATALTASDGLDTEKPCKNCGFLPEKSG